MIAISILRHSLSLLVDNWRDALRATAVPWGMQMVMLGLAEMGGARLASGPEMGTRLGILGVSVVGILTGAWGAAAWHRFILLGQRPAWVPRVAAGRVVGYLGQTLLLAIALFSIAILVAFVLAAAGDVAGVVRGPLAAVAIGWLGGLVANTVFIRLSVSLPGVALGESASLTRAWSATRGQSGTFVALAALAVMATAAARALPAHPALIVTLAWVGGLIGLTVLTTLWGHFVEGRPLR